MIGLKRQMCIYLEPPSATERVNIRPLMQDHPYAQKMQQETIDEIEASFPQFMVFVNVWCSWVVNLESNPMILPWSKLCAQKHYTLAGVLDIFQKGATQYYWDDEFVGYTHRSESWLAASKRKEWLTWTRVLHGLEYNCHQSAYVFKKG